MPDKYDMELDARPDEKICSICSEVITKDLAGWEGHNAEPINNGKCNRTMILHIHNIIKTNYFPISVL